MRGYSNPCAQCFMWGNPLPAEARIRISIHIYPLCVVVVFLLSSVPISCHGLKYTRHSPPLHYTNHESHADVHIYIYTFIYLYLYPYTYILTYRQTDRQTDRQTNRQNDKQASIQIYKHTSMHTYIHTHPELLKDTES